MSEMVDRVAKAISGAPFPSELSRRKARAAIEAMREPTAKMIDTTAKIDIERAGNDETNSIYNLRDEEIEFIWYAMIDEALK
jgi:hypothetical protein